MKLGSTRRDEPELNLTSLIDIVLLLVIFFMLATTFVTEGRLRVVLPQASAGPVETAQPAIVITITEQGSYRVNERALVNNSRDTLRASLRKVAGDDTNRPVTIRADARATHQSVVTAMDVAARLGFTQVNIATISQQTED
jgi:biopolymer transport protein ExbD